MERHRLRKRAAATRSGLTKFTADSPLLYDAVLGYATVGVNAVRRT
jgi:hypothetical protein